MGCEHPKGITRSGSRMSTVTCGVGRDGPGYRCAHPGLLQYATDQYAKSEYHSFKSQYEKPVLPFHSLSPPHFTLSEITRSAATSQISLHRGTQGKGLHGR